MHSMERERESEKTMGASMREQIRGESLKSLDPCLRDTDVLYKVQNSLSNGSVNFQNEVTLDSCVRDSRSRDSVLIAKHCSFIFVSEKSYRRIFLAFLILSSKFMYSLKFLFAVFPLYSDARNSAYFVFP